MKFLTKLFQRKSKIDWDQLRRTLEPKIDGLQEPAIRLVAAKAETGSKLGGKPFANANEFGWPQSNGRPMAFLAQLNLAELAKVHKYEWLGNEGTLLFFYDVEEMPWGFDPKDRGKWNVLLQRNPNAHIEFPEDLNESLRLEEKHLQPTLVSLFPDADHPAVDALGLTDEEIDLYIEITSPSDKVLHQVGGFPSPIQGNNMELESQLASNGIYLGDSKGYQSVEAKKLGAGAKDWHLLFQFDSDDDIDVMWGDSGTIYFWVQEQKSMQNEFDNCWLILQCS